jgi:hypothetical protein
MTGQDSLNDWKPISRVQLEVRLDLEKAKLSPALLKIFQKFTAPITEKPCFRTKQYGIERVFVIASSGQDLLFFDDVEDEFAIGVADEDGVLRDWGLYGDLMDALPFLTRNE